MFAAVKNYLPSLTLICHKDVSENARECTRCGQAQPEPREHRLPFVTVGEGEHGRRWCAPERGGTDFRRGSMTNQD